MVYYNEQSVAHYTDWVFLTILGNERTLPYLVDTAQTGTIQLQKSKTRCRYGGFCDCLMLYTSNGASLALLYIIDEYYWFVLKRSANA